MKDQFLQVQKLLPPCNVIVTLVCGLDFIMLHYVTISNRHGVPVDANAISLAVMVPYEERTMAIART